MPGVGNAGTPLDATQHLRAQPSIFGTHTRHSSLWRSSIGQGPSQEQLPPTQPRPSHRSHAGKTSASYLVHLPAAVVHQPQLAAKRRQAAVGVVGAQHQAVLRPAWGGMSMRVLVGQQGTVS